MCSRGSGGDRTGSCMRGCKYDWACGRMQARTAVKISPCRLTRNSSAPSRLSHWYDEWGRQDEGTNVRNSRVGNSTWSHAVGVPTYLDRYFCNIFERVNFIRPAAEMDSTGVTLGNSPDKVSPGIHQNTGWLGNFTGYVGVIHPKWGP